MQVIIAGLTRAIVAASPDVEKVILYGSRARGDAQEHSDIDLAVSGRNLSSGVAWSDVMDAVEDYPTLFMVDLVHFDRAPEELKQNISRDGVVLYERRKGFTLS